MNNLFLSFIPGQSFLHRLDPRAKILGVMLGSICILSISSYEGIVLAAGIFLVFVVLSGLPVIHFLHQLKPTLIFFLLLFVLQLFTVSGKPFFTIGQISATYHGFETGLIMILKFAFLILFAALLTSVTSPSEITAALEKLLHFLPVRYLGVSSHDLAMMMSLALYFLPFLYAGFRDLMDAQVSRGLDIKKKPLKAIFSFSVPLVRLSVRRVDEVALAMESRCYSGSLRTSVYNMKFRPEDHAFCACCVAAFLLCTLL